MNKSNRTVLHVDDDPLVLRIVAAQLAKLGYEVISIDDAHEAMDTIVEYDCRVVLLDIDMPGINGVTLLQEIKQHDLSIQVIMLTGVETMQTVLQSMKCGAEACIFKPINEVAQLETSLEASFVKVDRWWATLRELSVRKSQTV